MFKRRFRLSREEISEVSMRGVSYHTPYFSLKVLNSQKSLENKAKFAFVIGKKEEKTAVLRNKAKRRLRSAMVGYFPNLKPSLFIIFIKKTAINADFKLIKQELGTLLQEKGFLIKSI